MSAPTGRFPHIPPRWREDVWELRCRSCGEWWPLTRDFYTPYHGVARCNACWAAYQARWNRNRRGDPNIRAGIQEAQRMKHAADPEHRARKAAAKKAWLEANRDHARAYARAYYRRRMAAARLLKAAA